MPTKKIIKSCKKEFKISNCGFEHLPPDEFVKSQWQTRTKNLIFFIYRWVIALFFTAAVIVSMSGLVTAQDWGLYFIYLTNWGILMCMITTITGAVLVTIWHYHPEFADRIIDSNDMPTSFKVYWCFHNTTLILSLVITIIYWGILHNDASTIDATNILTHACNSFIMFLDLLIVAYPIRLMHVVQPVGMGLIYVIFSVIFYFAGGVDKKGNAFIYKVLDWSKPADAIITVLGTLLLSICIHVFLFSVYKLRTFIYSKLFKQKTILPTTEYVSTLPPTGISMVLGNYGHDNQAFLHSTEKIVQNNNKY